MKIKTIWNHHLDFFWYRNRFFFGGGRYLFYKQNQMQSSCDHSNRTRHSTKRDPPTSLEATLKQGVKETCPRSKGFCPGMALENPANFELFQSTYDKDIIFYMLSSGRSTFWMSNTVESYSHNFTMVMNGPSHTACQCKVKLKHLTKGESPLTKNLDPSSTTASRSFGQSPNWRIPSSQTTKKLENLWRKVAIEIMHHLYVHGILSIKALVT